MVVDPRRTPSPEVAVSDILRDFTVIRMQPVTRGFLIKERPCSRLESAPCSASSSRAHFKKERRMSEQLQFAVFRKNLVKRGFEKIRCFVLILGICGFKKSEKSRFIRVKGCVIFVKLSGSLFYSFVFHRSAPPKCLFLHYNRSSFRCQACVCPSTEISS